MEEAELLVCEDRQTQPMNAVLVTLFVCYLGFSALLFSASYSFGCDQYNHMNVLVITLIIIIFTL